MELEEISRSIYFWVNVLEGEDGEGEKRNGGREKWEG